MGKESCTPSANSKEIRNIFSQEPALTMGEDDLIKESGAVIRNNHHLNTGTDNNLEGKDGNDSYLLIWFLYFLYIAHGYSS